MEFIAGCRHLAGISEGHVINRASWSWGILCTQVLNLCLLKKKKEKLEQELGNSIRHQMMYVVTIFHSRVELVRNNYLEL